MKLRFRISVIKLGFLLLLLMRILYKRFEFLNIFFSLELYSRNIFFLTTDTRLFKVIYLRVFLFEFNIKDLDLLLVDSFLFLLAVFHILDFNEELFYLIIFGSLFLNQFLCLHHLFFKKPIPILKKLL